MSKSPSKPLAHSLLQKTVKVLSSVKLYANERELMICFAPTLFNEVVSKGLAVSAAVFTGCDGNLSVSMRPDSTVGSKIDHTRFP